MKLGILITTDRHLDHVSGLTRSAVAKGHEVIIFSMDSGTRFLEDPAFADLCNIKGVRVCFCDHSAQHQNIKKDRLPEGIVCGSQYNNALMMHASDKVIRL
ncbi:MAG: DsrE family protein [Nitrospiraceae bacterium]|nr:DsrE family protein [Nitrospiraceae bacterium]